MWEELEELFEKERSIYEKLLTKLSEEKDYILKVDFENVERIANEISQIIGELSNILLKRKEILSSYKGDEKEMEKFLQEKVKELKPLLLKVMEENELVHKILTFDIEFIQKNLEILKTGKEEGKKEGEKDGTISNNA
jgi:flagellar biosynthesis/type III secretory pathway chaperone